MSLYVGHLSPHARQEELERVFRRFGRCNLQLKDGYGFVVYEFTADAEKALRALRGKNICGKQITVNWSNRQPKPFQISARPTRFYEPSRGRNFREEDNGVGIRGSQDRRDFSTGTSHVPSYNRGGHRFADVVDKGAGRTRKDIDDVGEERGVNSKGVMDEGGTNEPNAVQNDRWGEPVRDALTGQGMGNGTEFDRYEPYQGYNRRDEKENNQRATSHDSPDHWTSQEKGRREHSIDETEKNLDKSKHLQTCYKCGIVGHIMHNCPEGDARRAKFSHRRDEISFRGRGDGRQKMLRTNSWGRPNDTRDPLISGHHASDRKESHSRKVRREARRSESLPERKEKQWPNLGVESQAKKKSKLEHGTQKKAPKKRRARRFDTSSLSSDSSSSQSHSQSLKSISGASSHSGSKSASSRSGSPSSSSRPASTSSYSKSNASRSRSRSRSSLRSLSVSLDEKPPSSPKKVHTIVSLSTSPKVDLDHASSPVSRHHLPDNMESSKLKDENALVSFKVDNETNGELSGHNGDDAHNSASIVGYKENNSCIDLLKDVAAVSENSREKSALQGALPVKPNMQTPVACEASNSTRITTQEMFSALKHYGLAVPEEGETGISIERYFGAARLWPWEMIYYRRLKKGPISTENYARRLEQNKQFGIVDKYIRSSSGWGEREQNDRQF